MTYLHMPFYSPCDQTHLGNLASWSCSIRFGGTTLSFKEELSSFISHYTHTHHPEAHHLDSKLIISMLPHQIVLSLYRPTPQPFCSPRSTLGTAGITSNRLCTHCQLSQQMRNWIGSHKLGAQNLISWRAHSRRKIWVKFREFKSRIQH